MNPVVRSVESLDAFIIALHDHRRSVMHVVGVAVKEPAGHLVTNMGAVMITLGAVGGQARRICDKGSARL